MSSHAYLNFGDSTYKSNCKVVGTSTYVAIGNGLKDSTVTEIQIPSSFDNKPIAEIGYQSFRDTQITKVFISKSVLFLNFQCFCNCYVLNEVRFEEGSCLEKISKHAFYDCYALEKIDIPATVTIMESASGTTLFYDSKAMICISYLGSTNFASGVFFSSYVPSKILVSGTYPSTKFGGNAVTDTSGKTCGASKEPFVPLAVPKGSNKCSFVIHNNTPNYSRYILFAVSS